MITARDLEQLARTRLFQRKRRRRPAVTRARGGIPMPGRWARGEAHAKATLTDAQVREMRGQYEEWQLRGVHKGYMTLAAIYGCAWPTARDIVKFRTRLCA